LALTSPGPDVVVLAAGKGTRMRSALPKVLHPLAGKPLLGHVLETCRALDARRIVVVYGHGGDAVPAGFAASGATFVLQDPQLGTGHALMQALPQLPVDGTTLVLFGDVPLVRPATLARALSHPGALCLLTATLDSPHGYGRILRGADGRVVRIVEEKDASDSQRAVREINTGILAAPTRRLGDWVQRLTNDNAAGEYYLTDVVQIALADGADVVAETVADAWEIEGVNSRAQLAALERRHQQQTAARLMAEGVSLADPARIDVRGRLHCAPDVSIDVGCVFEGEVTLGENVAVGAYCVVKDAQIGPGTVIAPFSHLDGVHVGAHCRVGPYARLRPGASLADHAHVGNFVEIKNATLGTGSKANHLTYLGDAVIGADVNIGAGTITCNYDGANKHRTVIEDGAFIGSDTALVAPVTVGRGATIGAGSTITRDAPPDKLTIARSKQATVPGWKRPAKKPRD
jgi:bifunctional UDP-N-acetylglucosamine pyrophosphorylase/glucosamine-1-phosphate N-acetyltransferase